MEQCLARGRQLLRVIVKGQVFERKKLPTSSGPFGAEKLFYQTKKGSLCPDILEKRGFISFLKTGPSPSRVSWSPWRDWGRYAPMV